MHYASQQAPSLTQPGPGRTGSDYKVSRADSHPPTLGAIEIEKTNLKKLKSSAEPKIAMKN